MSNYSWALTITRTGMNDNQQIATFDFSGGNYQSNGASYIYVCANPGQGANWGIWMDNFSITAGGTTYTEDFNNGESGFFKAHDASVVTYGIIKSEGGAEIGATPEEEVDTTRPEGEGYAIIDFKSYSSGKSYVTTNTYSSITEVKVDVYVPSTNENNWWWGFAPVASNSGDAYDGSDATAGSQNLNQILVNNYGWKDRWVTLTYTVSNYSWALTITRTGMNDNQVIATFDFSGGMYQSGGASYIFLSANPGQGANWGVWMDNFSITAGGVTYTDNFNTGESKLFTDNANCATYYYEESTGEEETPDAGETTKPEGEGHAILNFNGLTEGKQDFITTTTYSNITAMQVDVYIPSTNAINSWWGFAPVTTNGGDAYTGSDATAGNLNINHILVEYYGWKDRWVTLNYTVSGTTWTLSVSRTGVEESHGNYTYTAPSTTCYIFLGATPARAGNWGIWVDNFSITAGGVTYTDNFNTGESKLFTDNVGCATYHYEAPDAPEEPEVEGEGHAIIDFKSYSSGKSYVTTNAYSSITEVKVDVYVPSTNANNWWWGFAPVASNSGDAYDGSDATAGSQNLNQILVNNYGWKDRWVTLTYTVSNYSWTLTITRTGMNDNRVIATFDFSGGMYQSGGASYIFLSANPGQGVNWGVWVDNFSITAGGVTYTDNFNTGKSKLFTDNANCATYYYEAPEAPEVPEELPTEQNKFAEMLANEQVIDHILNSENYIRSNSVLSFEGMPSNMAIMEGKFTYSITDYKDVVIALSVTSDYVEYLRLYNSGIALYSGHTLLKEITLDSTQNTIYVSVLVNGKVLVQINDTGYVGLGQLSNQPTGFAIVDVAGSGSIKFSEILIDYYTAMTYGTEGIDFTAYASMPPANWNGSAGNANMITEEQYRLMKEAGFTKVLALYEGRNASAETDALIALALCEKLGLEYYALDANFYNFVRAAVSPELYESNGTTLKSNWEEIAEELIANMFNDELLYIDSPAYAGSFAADEPSIAEMQMMVTQIELYNKYVGYNAFYGGEAIVNLLPSYATSEQLGGTYTKYLDYYFENLAPLLGYACFDFYPIRNKTYLGFLNSRYIQEQHLYNLQLIAQYCEQYDVEMRTFVQSLTVEDEAGVEKVAEIDELRFQIYSALAFGSQEIVYYTYTASGDTEDQTKALVNFYTGATSAMYDWAKTVNNEVAAFGEAYVDYNWQKTYFNDTGSACSQANAMVSKESYNNVSSTVDTLTGVFTHKNTGKEAYMLVNYTDPYNTSNSGDVTLTFDTATTVEIWQNGVATTQTGTSITVTLGAGNGAFVIVK